MTQIKNDMDPPITGVFYYLSQAQRFMLQQCKEDFYFVRLQNIASYNMRNCKELLETFVDDTGDVRHVLDPIFEDY